MVKESVELHVDEFARYLSGAVKIVDSASDLLEIENELAENPFALNTSIVTKEDEAKFDKIYQQIKLQKYEEAKAKACLLEGE